MRRTGMRRPLVVAATFVSLFVSLTAAGCAGDANDSIGTGPVDRSTVTTTPPIDTSTSSVTSDVPTTAPGSSGVTATSRVEPTSTEPPPGPTSRFHPVPTDPPPPETTANAHFAARELSAEPLCDPSSPSTPAVTLRWRPGAPGDQLVAVATLPDGFETNRYTVSSALPADEHTYGISPIEPGGIYYWRVLTASDGGWTASEASTFTGPTCILDTPSPPSSP